MATVDKGGTVTLQELLVTSLAQIPVDITPRYRIFSPAEHRSTGQPALSGSRFSLCTVGRRGSVGLIFEFSVAEPKKEFLVPCP